MPLRFHAYRTAGMGSAGGAIPRNHGQNAGKRRFHHQNQRTARRRRCRRTAAFELQGIERSLKAGHQSRSQPSAPPLRRASFRCRQNLLLDTPLGQPEYEGRGIGPGGQNRQNRADTGGKRRNRPSAVRRRMAAVQP